MLINEECYRQIFKEQTKQINKSQWIFKMSSFGLNTRTETFAPLVNGIVNNALFHSVPHVNQKLSQIIHVLHFRLVDMFAAPGPRFCSQLDCGRGCTAAINPARWKQESRVQEDGSSHEPGAPEHCPAEIWRTRRMTCVKSYELRMNWTYVL